MSATHGHRLTKLETLYREQSAQVLSEAEALAQQRGVPVEAILDAAEAFAHLPLSEQLARLDAVRAVMAESAYLYWREVLINAHE